MTRSLNEIVYDVIELYRANYKVTDSLDERQVVSWINSTRATLLREGTKSIKFMDPHNVQTLSQVELELVDSINVPSLTNGGRVLRTKKEIPSFINGRDNFPMIVRVYGAEIGGEPFEVISPYMAPYSGSGKFNGNTIYVYYYNKKLYLTSKSGLHKTIKYITVDGLFSNPIEAYEFVNGEDSYDWNMEYPISESLVKLLMDEVIKTKFNFILYPPQDPVNNASDDLTNKPVE